MKALVLILLFGLPAFAEAIMVTRIRPRDLQEMLSIEAATQPQPFTEKAMTTLLRRRGILARVAIYDHQVVGFAIYELREGQIDVKRIVVHPEFRGTQVSDTIVTDLIGRLSYNRSLLMVNVPPSAKDEIATLLRKDFDVRRKESGDLVFQYNRHSFTPPTVAQLRGQTLYERLAIPETANDIEIERAYRRKRMAAKSDAARRLLDETFATLSDPTKRKYYDEELPRVPSRLDASRRGEFSRERAEELDVVARRKANPKSKNLYERLGVPPNAMAEVIEIAYWDAVKKEKKPANQALLDEAYRVLGRPSLRKDYDLLMTGVAKDNKTYHAEFLAGVPDSLPSTAEKLGFNPNAVDLYEVLGIPKDSLPSEIDQAYHRLADRYHDQEDVMAAIDKAHAILSNLTLRKEYDADADKLSLKEKREKVDLLFSRADEIIEQKFDETPDFLYPDFEHNEFLDHAPANPIQREALKQGSHYDLYSLLGLSPSATSKEIEARIDATNSNEFHLLGILPRDAKLVLLDPELRAAYDKFREGLGAYENDRDELGNFIEQAKILDLLKKGREEIKLRALADKLSDWILGLSESPTIASRVLDRLADAYSAEEGSRPVDIATRIVLLKTLGGLSHFDGKAFPDVRAKELAVRARIVRDAVKNPKSSARDLELLLTAYLNERPPDFLSAELRGRRDQIHPPTPLVRKADCDGFDVL